MLVEPGCSVVVVLSGGFSQGPAEALNPAIGPGTGWLGGAVPHVMLVAHAADYFDCHQRRHSRTD